ncbi:hypothetical protein ES703_93869 [subsurface metagenome]
MEELRDSKEYSWKWLLASELLCPTACDLTYVLLTSLTAAATAVTFYDGADNTGRVIAVINTLASRSFECNPHKPIYCRRGLYYENNAVETPGCLVQWRPRDSKEG